MSKPAIVIFTKNVRPGHVKTQLAEQLGEKSACDLYKALLGHTRELLEANECVGYVFYDQFINDRDDWDNCRFVKQQQKGETLCSRMESGCEAIFARGINPVLILAADCPLISQELLNQALAEAKAGKYVLGPTKAGGFYLLGMPVHSPWLFQSDWTKGARANSLQQELENRPVELCLLPTLQDVSAPEDLHALSYLSLITPFVAPEPK